MGNNPSATAKQPTSTSASPSPSPSPSPSSHEPTRAPSNRRDHPRNLYQSQRTGAAAEPSLAQARGTTATHRKRNSQSFPAAYLPHPSPPSQSPSANSPASRIGDSPFGSNLQSKPEEKRELQDEPTKPVAVPIPSGNNDSASLRSYPQSIEPSGPPAAQDMSYHITRPPRLPLPIEEEVHTPGSPIVAPLDVDAPVLDIDNLDDEALPRHSSALSNTTIDEEDAEELRVDKTKATVPTVFEWRRGGAKVYVTGTIFQWNKKHRLHPVEGQPGLLSAIIHVRPGTHHIRFIVDSIMQCSQDMPTTVDFGNNLVNYIEVSADDLPREAEAPIATESTSATIAKNDAKTSQDPAQAVEGGKSKTAKPPPKTKPVLPQNRFITEIPQYLIDLDKAEDTSAYQYAAAAIEKLPTPPSLPGFLGKPILNAATPMKDDNSVLIMPPNHTVLNHLATSSIKNNVLAVSATTRYKRKYVTTIMYKPAGND